MSEPTIMRPSKITLHCSASKNGVRWDISEIRKEHMENRGFSDVGYHKVIQPDGEVQDGRPLNVMGAHVLGHNEVNIGICLIGTDRFSWEQFRALRRTIDGLMMTFSILPENLFCHSQFDTAQKQGKTCPNIAINNFLVWYHLKDERAFSPYILGA